MRIAALTTVAFLAAASLASGYTVTLQATDYIASFNAGGADFYETPCGGATNGLGLEGYDYPGDWIELKLVISQPSTYRDSLRSAADGEAEGEHMVTIFDPGGVPVGTSYYRTVGLGIG